MLVTSKDYTLLMNAPGSLIILRMDSHLMSLSPNMVTTQPITISTAAGGLFNALISTIALLSSESTISLAFLRMGMARASSESASSLMTLASAAYFSTTSFSAETTLSFSLAMALSFSTSVKVMASCSLAFASSGNILVISTLSTAIEAFVFLRVVRPLASLDLLMLIVLR